MEFDELVEELAEGDEAIMAGAEDWSDGAVDVRFLRQLNYALQSVSLGSQQLLYFAGARYARNVELSGEGVEELFARVGGLFQAMDVGELQVAEIDEEEGEHRLHVHGSAFASEELRSDGPVCFFLSGLLSGFLRSFTGEKYIVNEVGCRGEGDDRCEFLVRRV